MHSLQAGELGHIEQNYGDLCRQLVLSRKKKADTSDPKAKQDKASGARGEDRVSRISQSVGKPRTRQEANGEGETGPTSRLVEKRK